MKKWYDTNGPSDAEVFQKALLNECKEFSAQADLTNCQAMANCQYRKIHLDVHTKAFSTERTCIDIGYCSGSISSWSNFSMVDWTATTHNYQANRCVPVTHLVLHHTVTTSAQETLDILNTRGLSVQYIAGKDGTIYQMVHDYYRAWHAGTSHWGNVNDLNSHSVGVEIVNTGDEPFTKAQMDSVINLSAMLISRWHLEPHNIVGHFDIHPAGKNDPSGYFDWKYYYTKLGLYEDIWPSALSDNEKKTVLMSKNSFKADQLKTLQTRLRNWGYAGSLAVTGAYDLDTEVTIQAFNRHWCPEIFIPESVDQKTNCTITVPSNQVWYRISEERLTKLLQAL